MARRFTQKTELGLSLSNSVEVVLHKLCESGILEGFSKGNLLFVQFAHLLSVFCIVSLVLLLFVHLLHEIDLRVVEGGLPGGLGGLSCDP